MVSKLISKRDDHCAHLFFKTHSAISIMPVVVYPKKYINDLKEELTEVKRKINSDKQPIFDSVDDLFEHLESE